MAQGLTPLGFRASLARGVRRNISLGLNGRRDHDINVKFAEQARRSGDKIEIIYDQYGAINWQWKS
jgi:hypothetical protein